MEKKAAVNWKEDLKLFLFSMGLTLAVTLSLAVTNLMK